MAVYKRVSGAWVPVTSLRKKVSGSMVTSTSLKVRQAGAWVEKMISPLTASASPAFLNGLKIGTGAITKSTTVTASGGVPPYSYSTIWSSGGAGLSVINGGTSNPGASGSNSPTNTYTGTLRCRVTDAESNYVDVFISVDFSWEN